MQDPTISVIIPTLNSEKYLEEALGSILRQSFTDFEILVIDGNSTDGTLDILQKAEDERISVLQAPGKGLANALNFGLVHARGTYIARMDADDIADAYRFEKQVSYLEKHPDIGVCGTLFQEFMGGDAVHDHMEDVRFADMLSGCYIGHPTVMFRRQQFVENGLWYDESLRFSEDYDLWTRAIRTTRLANVPEILLQYRRHPESVSIANVQTMTKIDVTIKVSMLDFLVGGLSARQKQLLEDLFSRNQVDGAAVEIILTDIINGIRHPELCSRLELLSFFQNYYPIGRDFLKRTMGRELQDIPFYIISFNQLAFLRQLIDFLEKNCIRNIQIIDNKSDYAPLIDYLQASPHTVHWMEANYGHMVLFEHEKFKESIENGYFVLTDPDILPTEACPDDFLYTFLALLLRYPMKNKAGFSLKIDDLPKHYGLRDNVIAWESRFYSNRFIHEGIPVYDAPIDTTFALNRPRKQWKNKDFFAALRVGAPYTARHLPWYKDLRAPSEEDIHYKATDQGSSNWNGRLSSKDLHKKYNTSKTTFIWKCKDALRRFLQDGRGVRIDRLVVENRTTYSLALPLLEKREASGSYELYAFSCLPLFCKKTQITEKVVTTLSVFRFLPLASKIRLSGEQVYKLFGILKVYKKNEREKELSFGNLSLLAKKTSIHDATINTGLYALGCSIPLLRKTTVKGSVTYHILNFFVLPVRKK